MRTGLPPSSVTSSGTARLVIRLWMIVEPGSLASSRAAIRAVSVEGETASPCSSTRKQRSASPSKARPMSAPDRGDPLLQVDEVGRLDGVGLVVGEGTVELEVHRHDLDLVCPEALEDRGRGQPGHAVAGVDDDLQLAPGHRREGQEVGGVRLEDVLLADAADGRGRSMATAAHRRGDVREAGVGADRLRARAAHLHAVVLRRVVARGEHHARVAESSGREVELVGGGQADHDHVGARGGRARGEGARQIGRAGPHVVADDDRRGADDLDERGTRRAGKILVELVRDGAADVVGLEDRVDVGRVQRAGARRHGFSVVRAIAVSTPRPDRSSDGARPRSPRP